MWIKWEGVGLMIADGGTLHARRKERVWAWEKKTCGDSCVTRRMKRIEAGQDGWRAVGNIASEPLGTLAEKGWHAK